MKLTTMHQLLMGAMVTLCLIFALRGVLAFAGGGGALDLAMGLIAVVVGAGVVAYLRQFRRKLAKRSPSNG